MRKKVFLVIFSVLLGLQVLAQGQFMRYETEVDGIVYEFTYYDNGNKEFPENLKVIPINIDCENANNGHLDIDIPAYIRAKIPVSGSWLDANFPVSNNVYNDGGKIDYQPNCGSSNITSIKFGTNYVSEVLVMYLSSFYLTSIEVAEGNKDYFSKDGVLYNRFNQLICYPEKKIGESFIIPEGITSIKSSAFGFNDNLVSIIIPQSCNGLDGSVTNIFASCRNLTSIEVAEGNTRYSSEDGVWYNSDKTQLIGYPAKKAGESFIIPESVTSIGRSAFANNTNLTSITTLNPIPFNAGFQNGFSGVAKTCTLYVPAGSKEAYQNASLWKDFVNIVEIGSEDKDPEENPCQELEENPDPNYTYRYFLWGGTESKTKPAKGVNHYRVTFYKGNPTKLEKYKCD